MRAAAFRLLRGACCATLLVWGCVGRDGTVSGAPAPRGRNRVRRLDVVLLHIVPEEIAQIDRLHDLERRLEVTSPPVVAEQRPDGIHAEGAGDWWCRWSVTDLSLDLSRSTRGLSAAVSSLLRRWRSTRARNSPILLRNCAYVEPILKGQDTVVHT